MYCRNPQRYKVLIIILSIIEIRDISRIHLLNLLLILLTGVFSLKFEGGSEEVVLNAERFVCEEELLSLLESVQLGLFFSRSHIGLDVFDELLVFADSFDTGEVGLLVLGPPELGVLGVGDNDSDGERFGALAIDEALGDTGGFLVGHFDLLRGDILALRELEHILSPVDDFERSVGSDDTDISRP